MRGQTLLLSLFLGSCAITALTLFWIVYVYSSQLASLCSTSIFHCFLVATGFNVFLGVVSFRLWRQSIRLAKGKIKEKAKIVRDVFLYQQLKNPPNMDT